MKGDPKVIEALNDVLSGELTAINQYFLHARMTKNWGYKRVAKKVYDASIHQMKQASDLADRILLLEGLPNFQKLEKLQIGENTLEILKSDLRSQEEAVRRLRSAIQVCLQVNDHATRDMLEGFLSKEEDHVDWLETQLNQIAEIGFERYLAEQID